MLLPTLKLYLGSRPKDQCLLTKLILLLTPYPIFKLISKEVKYTKSPTQGPVTKVDKLAPFDTWYHVYVILHNELQYMQWYNQSVISTLFIS